MLGEGAKIDSLKGANSGHSWINQVTGLVSRLQTLARDDKHKFLLLYLAHHSPKCSQLMKTYVHSSFKKSICFGNNPEKHLCLQ
ncbi:MAG: hypothetical protein ACJASL_005018 [Paraglaciecola sp.]